jgi:hypothetical protein
VDRYCWLEGSFEKRIEDREYRIEEEQEKEERDGSERC